MQSARRLILSMLKHYLFWLALFAFARCIFLLWNREELADVSLGHILFAFVKGLYVDTAMACYLLLFPFGIILITAATGKARIMNASRYVHGVLFFSFFLLVLSELAIYDEWHTKLNYKALWFFGNPSEVFNTASWTQTSSILFLSALGTFLSLWCYRKLFPEEFHEARFSRRFVVSALIIPLLLFIGIRGGFHTIPIQLSDAYYSQHNVLNLASVNSMFNLSSSVIENAKAKKPYDFLTEEEANKQFAALFTPQSDTMNHILTTQRPNIVLVVLEGWSADMLESFKGIKGHNIAPHLDSIAMAGLRFTDCYASGSLSDQGMAAVFSAFPAQPLTSIITQPDKYTKLPCISKKLKAEGYQTSFLFGGQLSYGNIRSYMYFNEFDKIIEQEHFADNIPKGKLGAHDEFLFERQLQELKGAQEPFFAAMFTLSTHGPYDFPSNTDLNFGGKEEEYVNSVHYADSCIGDFMAKARREPWYDNTLFIFISDHSHNTPMNYAFVSPQYRRIPFIMYGNVLDSAYRGFDYEPTVAQTDLTAILLAQLGADHSEFKYSQNVFGFSTKMDYPGLNWAYYSFEEGFGFVEASSAIVWHVDGRGDYILKDHWHDEQHFRRSDSLELLKKGQSVLQTVSADYARY
jgi:phosphoglycerol transferase MdoB-like AlkP superfamily enzyme